MAQARAAVDKARIRTEGLAAMDEALKDKSATAVYRARDLLRRRSIPTSPRTSRSSSG